jgi:hypothetical protein
MLKVDLSKEECKALATSMFVAHTNALFELRRAREKNVLAMVEYLQMRVTALDKLREQIELLAQ